MSLYGTINGTKFTPTLQMESAKHLARVLCEGEATWHPDNTSTVPCSIHLSLADSLSRQIMQEYYSHGLH